LRRASSHIKQKEREVREKKAHLAKKEKARRENEGHEKRIL